MTITTPPRQSAASIRERELAQIHIAKSQLAMADDAYRAVLWSVARVSSAKDLDWAGRKKVLDHLKSCGFKGRPKLAAAHAPLALSKEQIEAKIAVQLKAMGQNWPYAYGVGRRIFPGVARFEFLTAAQLGDVSSALERTARYKKARAGDL